MLPVFNPEVHELGKLCRRGHDYNGNGESLRYIANQRCATCRCEYDSKKRKRPPKPTPYAYCPYPQIVLSTSLYTLGNLCVNLHDWGNGQSVRLLSNNQCFECRRTLHILTCKTYEERKPYFQNWQRTNRDKVRAAQRRYLDRNPDYSKDYYRRNRETVRPKKTQYKRDNPELMRAQRKTYYQKNKSKITMSVRVRQQRIFANNHHVAWSRQEETLRRQEFSNCCAYCSISNPIALDHFIPLIKGGSDCIGNIVPACTRCNSSKRDCDPKEWFQRQEFYSVKKWRHILNVLRKTESNYMQITLL